MDSAAKLYAWILDKGDPRTEDWPLVKTPVQILAVYVTYLLAVWLGPKIMRNRKPFNLKHVLIPYNLAMQVLSVYMCYEFTVTAYLSGYSLVCQPVDYSINPLAMRMAKVCWWFFFSKVIELLDTVFFILRKKNSQITFLHVYHHSTMILNWWIAIKYIPGGQSFFMGIINSGVHVIMYGYYCLASMGPHMQKYLWWKKYITQMQLTQFVVVLIHTLTNMYQGSDCDFPQFLNYIVTFYALSLIVLFSNFFYQSYVKRKKDKDRHSNGSIGKAKDHSSNGFVEHSNGTVDKKSGYYSNSFGDRKEDPEISNDDFDNRQMKGQNVKHRNV